MTLLDDRVTVTTPAETSARPGRSWERLALFALLGATAVLYLWGLGASGWANNYYAAAVQAGSQDWKAWLFGSLDPGNAITVDKPPAALWVMGLSARIFGFSPFSMLLPEALMGVGAVALLYASVRRCSGPAAGLIAGAVMALTPVAAVMFRYNNPDALLVLLLTAAAYFMLRAIDSGATRWIVLAGTAIGFAFLTKMLQAALVLPAFALVFLLAAPGRTWKRLWQLLIGAAAMAISGGWLIALVNLWPAESRPYIGGSTDNSLLQLALGYNGVQRVAGETGPAGNNNPMFGGSSGIGRLFAQSMGTEVSWLLPAALIGLVAGVWFTARTDRTGRVRAHLLLWGGWLLVSGAVFSFMEGVIHPYYTVALAPAIAALIGISVRELWQGREFFSSRAVLATMSASTGVWAFILLNRTPDWLPALRWIVLVGSIAAAAVMAVGAHRLGSRDRCGRRHRATVRPRRTGSLFDRHGRPVTQWAGARGRTRQRRVRPRTRKSAEGTRHRQRRAAAIADGRPKPLGRGNRRVHVGERDPAADRCFDHGDRRLQRIGQLAHAGAVPAVCRGPPGSLLHRRQGGRPARAQRHRKRDHRLGGATFHRHGRRWNDCVRPDLTSRVSAVTSGRWPAGILRWCRTAPRRGLRAPPR